MVRAVEGLMDRFGLFPVLLLEFVVTAKGITAAVEEVDRMAHVDERSTRNKWICLSARNPNSLWARKQAAMVVCEYSVVLLRSQLFFRRQHVADVD